MKQVIFLCIFFSISTMASAQLTGVKTIPGSYPNIQVAVDSLNAFGVGTGGVTFQISSGQVFNLTANTFALKITATGTAANPIVFQKSGAGANPVLSITGGSATIDAGVWLNGGDYITFDGIDIQAVGSSSANYLDYGFFLSGTATDGCRNITLKNLVIRMPQAHTGAYSIYASSTASNAAGRNSYNLIQNVTIKNSIHGITFTGITGFEDVGNSIQNVLIDSIGVSTATAFGITLASQDSSVIANALVSNVVCISSYLIQINSSKNFTLIGDTVRNVINGSSGTVYAIYFTNSSGNNLIKGNVIHTISSSGGGINAIFRQLGSSVNHITENKIFNLNGSFLGGQLFGILARDGTATDYIFRNSVYGVTSNGNLGAIATLYTSALTNTEYIYNNFVYDIKAPATSSTYVCAAYYFIGGNIKLYFNTGYVNYTSTNSTNTSAALYVYSANGATLDSRNNILVNTSNVTTGTRAVAFWWAGTSYANISTVCNNNLLYAGASGVKNSLFFDGSNAELTIGTMKTRLAPRESSSVTEMPPFMSVVSPFNLHLNPLLITQAESGGQQIITPAITTDFDGDVRWGNPGYVGTGTAPDIGADEFSIMRTDCGLTTLIAPEDTLCSGNQVVAVTLKNFGPVSLSAVKLSWSVNGISQPQYSWTGILAPNASMNVTIGNYNFNAGILYSIRAFSTFPNNSADTFPANDTIFKAGIFVKQTPSFTWNSPAYSICSGDSAYIHGSISGVSPFNLVLSHGASLLSFSGLGTSSFSSYLSPSVTTSYNVSALTDSSGCVFTGISPVVITVNPLPAAVAGPDKQYCFGGSTNLGATAVSGNTYQWTPSTGLNNATVSNPIASPTVTTTYTLVETRTATGCVDSNTVVVKVNPIPIADAGSNQVLTTGSTTTLSGNATAGIGPYLYNWTPANLLLAANVQNPTTQIINFSTIFTLLVTDSVSGCSDTDNVMLTVSGGPIFSIAAASPTGICIGSSSQLNVLSSGGTGSYIYTWSSEPSGFTSTSIPNPVVSPTVTTKYYVLISDGTLSRTDSITVIVYANPVALITPAGSTSICQGSSLLLNATTGTGNQYKWFKDNLQIPGALSASYTTNSAGSYELYVTNSTNCMSISAPVVVVVNPNPIAPIAAGGAVSVCAGDSVKLFTNNSAGLTYQWRMNALPINNATDSVYYVKQSGVYSVLVTNVYTCTTTSGSQTVAVNPIPNAQITPAGSTTICSNASVLLNGNTGAGQTYKWYKDGVLITGAGSSFYAASLTGSYTLLVTSSANCSKLSSAVSITHHLTPTSVIASTGNLNFCQGDSVLLTASTDIGTSWQWRRDGAAISSATATTHYAKLTGAYTAVASNTNCNVVSNSINVVVFPLPTSGIFPSGPTDLCPGGSVLLNASSGTGYTHQWYKDGVILSGSMGSFYVATTAGSYTVVITSSGICTATSAPIAVTINPAPSASISPTGPINFCTGDSAVLSTATGSGLSYQWKRNSLNIIGASGSAYTAKQAGTYTVVITNSTNCSATSSGVVVNVIPPPSAYITPQSSLVLCPGASVTLNANTGTGLSYQWYKDGNAISGAVLPVYTTNQAGAYTVQVSNASNCSNTSLASSVSLASLPTVNLGADQTLAATKSLTLDAGAGFSSYLWNTSASTQTILVTGSQHTYGQHPFSVTVTNAQGCSDADTVIVTVFDDTGIEQGEGMASVSVYPNPNSGSFTVSVEGIQGNVQLEILDITGRKLYASQWMITGAKAVRDINLSLPTGVYMLHLESDTQRITRRILLR